MTLRKSVVLGLVMAVGVSCLAQTTTKKDGKAAKTEEKKAAQPPMPKPSPEIVRAEKSLGGTWKLTGKILDEQWAPGGATGTGTETVRKGPGGFSIISDSRMNWTKLGPMQGHGVLSWDDQKKAFMGLWCDNWAPKCESMGEGKWEGANLVFTGDMDMGPAKVPTRMTYSNITANSYDWKMESGDGKGNWKPEMTLKYEKASAAPATTAEKK